MNQNQNLTYYNCNNPQCGRRVGVANVKVAVSGQTRTEPIYCPYCREHMLDITYRVGDPVPYAVG